MIQTLTGQIHKSKLGRVLPHEHILIDLRDLTEAADNQVFHEKLSLENRWRIYSDPYMLPDNAFMDSEDVALAELLALKADGCETLVDVTLDEIGRNPEALKRLSEKSGVNIVMGCGFYIAAAHTEAFKRMTVKEAAARMIDDLTVGVRDTGIKAGVIGEIGTSASINENEYKALDAAADASLATGAGIHIHTSLYERNGLAVADRLIARGVKPSRICIDHIDVVLRSEYLYKLLDKGVYIEFDNFGKEFYIQKRKTGTLRGRFAYDLERAKMIKRLVDRGYEKQILMTNDICIKSMLRHYGGNGYGHIFRNIVSMLQDKGISAKQADILVRENPADFLDMEGGV
jgi:phosphotriesterase-related protein